MALAAVVACLAASLALAAPNGYSISSDSPGANADSLFLIDLADGSHTFIGPVLSLNNELRGDVEGLAFAPDGTLYGADDGFATFGPKLFPINTTNGRVVAAEEVFINGLPSAGGGNDFGMTFACNGNLYISSVTARTLYRLGLDGSATPIGSLGSLGVSIVGLAAYGNPVQLYGLGRGWRLLPDDTPVVDVPNLYQIDIQTGVATEIGPLGGVAGQYFEGGLSFDESGQLWAMTDRDKLLLPSQVMKVDRNTGAASDVLTLTEIGFESLAISPPRGCFDGGEGENARFTVTKRFMDQNNIRNVRFTLSCNTGLPLEQSITVQRPGGPYQDAEITFVVTDFESGALDCQLREQVPTGYEASYSCDGESNCSAGTPSPVDPYFTGPCEFTDVEQGDENLCFIRNYVRPVDVEVTKLWIDENEEFQGPTNAEMAWACVNARSSGDDLSLGTEEGFLSFQLPEQTEPFSVYPNFDPAQPTVCTVMEEFPGFDSDIESDDSDCDGLEVSLGSGAACTVVNTRLYPGIPTLSDYGKLLLVLLLLSVGLIGVRRTL